MAKKPPRKPTRRREPPLESKRTDDRDDDGDVSSPRRRKRKRKKSSALVTILRRFLLFCLGAAVVVFLWMFYSLPDISTLGTFTKTPSILIKSEDGRIIGSFGDIYGQYTPFNQLPQSLVDAVIATEDRNFYHNIGIDPWGLLRAAVADVRAGHVVQGGSTITQQVAKNVFLTPERSFTRKLKEMLLALKLEQHFSKQDIMSIYLNRVYLGAGNYGVDAAAHRYFGKSARDLTLPESAILAGMLKAPSRFAPTSNPELSRKRADQVLINMKNAGYLTARQAAHAQQELAEAMKGREKNPQTAFYFSDWIADQIPQYIGNVQDDIVVITTLRPDWQAMAEKAVADIMDKDGPSHRASQAALVAMTPDGAVRAMVGGRSYAKSQYNRATQALRQPGSSFKIFVYLAALEAGFTPDSPVIDQPVSIPIAGGTWEPKNYTHKYLGSIPMSKAVSESVNTVAVQVAVGVGLDRVISMARRLGITTPLEAVPSIALGSTEVTLLELTTAYAQLASGGEIVYPYGIDEITNTQGKPIYQREAQGVGQVLAKNIVHEMNSMLEGVIEHGTGRAANIGRPAAGKTGTTSDYRDAWFMGYTPQLVTGVWVGNDDNSAMKRVTGGMLPAHIWHDFMAAALKGAPVEDIPTSTGFFQSLLPWQTGAPNPPPAMAVPQVGPPTDMPPENGPPDMPPENGPPDMPPDQMRPAPPMQPIPQDALPPMRMPPAGPPPAQDNARHDVILGPDFWNKLLH